MIRGLPVGTPVRGTAPDAERNAVHVVAPRLDPADAVGTHARLLHRALLEHGYHSRLWASWIHPDLRVEASHVGGLFRSRRSPQAVVYQFASSCPLVVALAGLDNLIVDYHGLTPAELLRPWHPHAATDVAIARSDLAVLSGVASVALADSRFLVADLEAAGARSIAVKPLLMDPRLWLLGARVRASRRTSARRYGAQLLSVGRIASSKAVEDLLTMLAAYRAIYDPAARLTVVGRPTDGPYPNALRALASDLGLTAAFDLPGTVSTDQLSGYYQQADLLVSASRHEGFSATLVEAMAHGLPVVARRQGAVPETVAGAALLLPDCNAAGMAAAVRRVVVDDRFRDRLVAKGVARAGQLSPERSTPAVVAALEAWIGPPRRAEGSTG